MNSFNHYAYGAVGAFMVRTVAGLEIDEENPGYRHILFQPHPGGSLEWAQARLETDRGPISIRWERDGEFLNIDLEIPAGSTATLKLPNGAVEAGLVPGIHRHQFRQPAT